MSIPRFLGRLIFMKDQDWCQGIVRVVPWEVDVKCAALSGALGAKCLGRTSNCFSQRNNKIGTTVFTMGFLTGNI